jgi:HIRAN domain
MSSEIDPSLINILTPEELAWISQSTINTSTAHQDVLPPIPKKLKLQSGSILPTLSKPEILGEITLQGYCLVPKRDAPPSGAPLSIRYPSRELNADSKRPSSKKQMFYQKNKPCKLGIVRVYWKDYEIGKLATEDSTFLSVLIDNNIISITANLIYIADTLSAMNDMLMECQIYIRPDAFIAVQQLNDTSASTGEPPEKIKAIKAALGKLFERLMLWKSPVSNTSTMNPQSSAELNPTDLAMIYNNAGAFDKKLTPRKPDPGMLLTLREYQEIALEFMVSKETANAQLESAGMSPLWKAVCIHDISSRYKAYGI